jgi:predicted acylesterase/phospholipase RssA
MNKTNIQHLVLSGGGLLGISYIGLFKYFEEYNTLSNLKTVTGCSVGAIFGTLLILGYKSTELDSIIKSMVFKDYLNINIDSILNFMTTKGLESGKKLNIFIKKYIKEKTGDENITFLQIQEKYNIKLQIGVTNLTKSKFELFNVDITPDIPIEKAISASIAIPFVFEPIAILDDIYCDGGLLNNLPIENLININYINKLSTINKNIKNSPELKDSPESKDSPELKDSPESQPNNDIKDNKIKQINNYENESKESQEELTIIGFYLINKNTPIINKDNSKIISLLQYMSIITQTLSRNMIYTKKEQENSNKLKYKIINIEIPCDIMTFIKLNATHDDINNIINIAYDITKKELDYEK